MMIWVALLMWAAAGTPLLVGPVHDDREPMLVFIAVGWLCWLVGVGQILAGAQS